MFLSFLILLFVYYLFVYISDDYMLLSVNVAMGLYIALSLFFLFYRRRNNIFCPELLLLFTYFIILFFTNLTPNDNILNIIYTQWSDILSNKSLCVGMIAFLSFMIGTEVYEHYFKVKNINRVNKEACILVKEVSPTIILRIQSVCNILLVIILLYVIGSKSYMSFFKYSQSLNVDTEQTVSIILYLSVILSVFGVSEFIKLNKEHIVRFKDFIKKVDKRYLFYVGIIGVFFLVSGNRNESLFILFPPIILYSVLIKSYNIKQIIIGGLLGVFVMLLIGFTRGEDLSVENAFKNRSGMEYIKDFGAANVCQKGLIEYTDMHGCVGFTSNIINFLGSFPFVGGLIKNFYDNQQFTRSSVLTTDNYQSKDNMDSGLGTSLIGDLYYSGNITFVMFYMFAIGMLCSFYSIKITKTRSINIYHLLIYVYFFSDMIYYLRAEWYTIFRYIVFSLILTYLLINFFSKLKIRI